MTKRSFELAAPLLGIAVWFSVAPAKATPVAPFDSGSMIVSHGGPSARFEYLPYAFNAVTVDLTYTLSISGTGTGYDGIAVPAFCVDQIRDSSGMSGCLGDPDGGEVEVYLYNLSDLYAGWLSKQNDYGELFIRGAFAASRLADRYFDGTNQHLIQAAVWELVLETLQEFLFFGYPLWRINAHSFQAGIPSLLTTEELALIQSWLNDALHHHWTIDDSYILVSPSPSIDFWAFDFEFGDLVWSGSGVQGFLVRRAVPEPSTLPLLGLALLGLAGFGRPIRADSSCARTGSRRSPEPRCG